MRTPYTSPGTQEDMTFSAVLAAGSNFPLHKWQSGYLILWRRGASPSVPSVAILDRAGTVIHEAVVWLPEAVRLDVADVTVNSEGRLIVSGTAVKADGALASFIALYERGGKMGRVIRTGPFVPNFICSAQSDSVWAYGFSRRADSRSKPYPMLREYSFSSGLKKYLLNRTTLPDQFFVTGALPGDVGLRCNQSKVALFVAEAGELIEHDLRSEDSLVRTKLPPPPDGLRVTGYSLDHKGEFFASLVQRDKNGDPVAQGLFHLQRGGKDKPSKWVEVKGTLSAKRYDQGCEVIGINGNEVVCIADRLKGTAAWVKLTRNDTGDSVPPAK